MARKKRKDVIQEEEGITLAQKVTWFENSEDMTREARELSERDRDYVDNKQWTAEEVSELKKRGQPVVIDNRIKRKIDFLGGLEANTRTDPKAYPRTPMHEKDADAVTDALRYVADVNDFARVKSEVVNNMFVEGCGGAEIKVSQKPDGKISVDIVHVAWDRIFYDPHSRLHDFSDAKYKGYVIWLDAEDAKADYPDAAKHFDALITDESSRSETYGDRPKTVWADGKRKRIRIVQMYYEHDGDWYNCIFTKGAELYPATKVEYVDEYGQTECPLELQSAYVDRDNNRYGIVREMISLQDEINKRRSKSLHLLNARNVIADKGAVQDVPKAKRELAKPDGWIEKTPNTSLELQPMGDLVVGQMNMLQEAKASLDLIGPNAAMQGKDPRDQSGRAIMAQQQGGNIEITPLLDRARSWQKRVFKQVWNRIRQYWTEETWVRVTDDESNMRWVGLNRPVTFAEKVAERFGGQLPPEAEAQMAMDPRANVVVEVQNQTANIEVDIIIDEQPDVITLQHEQFSQLAEMASRGVPIPPDALIEASSLRSDAKRRILEKMQPDPAQQQMQAEAANLQKQDIEADISKKRADAAKSKAQAVQIAGETVMQAMMPPPMPVQQGIPA